MKTRPAESTQLIMRNLFHTQVRIPKGIDISEPGKSGSVVEKCTLPNTENMVDMPDNQASWCYLFVHHKKVKSFTESIEKGDIRYFVHKSVTYQRKKHGRGVQTIEKPTISGLIFLQGNTKDLQCYLDAELPNCHLVKNCSTHLPAVIPNNVMEPFMRVLETSPERVRFLLHPFRYYAGGNVKLRLISGFLAGIEGYVIRIDRDRRLVMDVGGMSVAISGVHCEKFEIVEEPATVLPSEQHSRPLNRHLTELQSHIDSELYKPQNQTEVSLIADVLDLWKERAVIYMEKWQVTQAKEILFFLLEEIDYYFSSIFASKSFDTIPVLDVAHRISTEISSMLSNQRYTEETREELEAERESCLSRFGYLLGE